jgi:hypothetical protein
MSNNENQKTYNASSPAVIPHDPDLVAKREAKPEEHSPTWTRKIFDNEAPEFAQIANEHFKNHPPTAGDEGHLRTYYGRTQNYYYYKTKSGRWTLIGLEKQFEELIDLTNSLKFDLDSPSTVKRYHTDFQK